MTYTPIPVTERTLKVKEEYLRMAVPMEDNPYVDKRCRHFYTGDRWITLGFLEGWLKRHGGAVYAVFLQTNDHPAASSCACA